MPGFDGTGPLSRGPMTGRGMGYCGAGISVRPRFGYGRGTGRGLGRGWFCRGLGIGYGGVMQPVGPQMRKADLREYADFLKDELKAIKGELERIEEALESETPKDE